MKNSRPFLRSIPVLAVLLTLLPAGCSQPNRITTNAAGHTITARLDGAPSVNTRDDQAVIACESGKVTIEAARARLGNGPWNRIPEQVPVSVGISKHKRWITAGGVSIEETN